jgi:hypothetical protein
LEFENEDKQRSIKSAIASFQAKLEKLLLGIAAVMLNKDLDAFIELLYKRYWRILVNEESQFKISKFLEGMIKPACKKLFDLKEENKTVEYIPVTMLEKIKD